MRERVLCVLVVVSYVKLEVYVLYLILDVIIVKIFIILVVCVLNFL